MWACLFEWRCIESPGTTTRATLYNATPMGVSYLSMASWSFRLGTPDLAVPVFLLRRRPRK